jgi:hypothetical protein
MIKTGFAILMLFAIFVSCKKTGEPANGSVKELYPVATSNKWIYVDSFFNGTGVYYGKDTFTLKVAKPITFNGHSFTPITDQFDDSIFVVRSTDSTVFMLEPPGAMLFYKQPSTDTPPFITTSYNNDTYNSVFSTQLITSTNFPSFKIVITRDDGQWFNYKQKIFFFTPGIGVIKGSDLRKTRNGIAYTYDSYALISYSLY